MKDFGFGYFIGLIISLIPGIICGLFGGSDIASTISRSAGFSDMGSFVMGLGVCFISSIFATLVFSLFIGSITGLVCLHWRK